MGRSLQIPKKESLTQGDLIECGITLEVDTGKGKAWVKYGTTSQVLPGETTEAADARVENHVRKRLDELIANASS